MTAVKQAGTRVIYNTTVSATLAAQGPLASIPSGWTAVANIQSVDDVKPREIVKFDDASLEDTAEVPDLEFKPGMASFGKKKNSQSAALFTLSDAGTKAAWGILYADGSAHVAQNTRIVCQSAAKATANDYQHKVLESFNLLPDTVQLLGVIGPPPQ